MSTYRDMDFTLWERYKKNKTPMNRSALLKRFEPLLHSRVNKWVGSVPKDVLMNEAKLLAIKAFDSYDPTKGAALSTHITNSLAPISRVVYTHQNAARLPENITMRVQSFTQAKDHISTMIGREPTTDELHQELGWSSKELDRIQTYMRKDLTESVGGLHDTFYDDREDKDDDSLTAIYYDLMPDEKVLFEHTTGFNGKEIMSNPKLMKKMNLTQAQLSYKKTLLKLKIKSMMDRMR